MRIALQIARRELDARIEAGKVLDAIRLAITDLRVLLNGTTAMRTTYRGA
jgi:hypothetical protein